jgi:hypothetical protein
MDRGTRLYEDRSFDAAILEFERAFAEKAGPGPLINIALCHKGRAEYVLAYETLVRALKQFPDAPQVPQMTKARDQIKELLAEVHLQVAPSKGHRIFVDGRRVTPKADGAIDVDPGSRELRVEADDYDPWTGRYRIGAGDSLKVTATLAPNTGVLSIPEQDDEVSITVDGVPAGKAPLELKLPRGTHLVVLRTDDETYRANIAVVAAKKQKVELARSFIVLDGKPLNQADEKPPNLGPYIIGGFAAGIQVSGADAVIGPDVQAGYRFTPGFWLGGQLQQIFNATQEGSPLDEYGDPSRNDAQTTLLADMRLTTDSDPVRFLVGLGLGTVFYREQRRPGFGVGSTVSIGVEGEIVEGWLLDIVGFANVSIVPDITADAIFGGRVAVGYGFW